MFGAGALRLDNDGVELSQRPGPDHDLLPRYRDMASRHERRYHDGLSVGGRRVTMFTNRAGALRCDTPVRASVMISVTHISASMPVRKTTLRASTRLLLHPHHPEGAACSKDTESNMLTR